MTESDPSGQEPQETAPGPGTVRLEDQLCFALYAATNAVTRAYRPDLMALGLTYPQYLMMMVLWQYGRATPSEIARRLGLGLNALPPVADQPPVVVPPVVEAPVVAPAPVVVRCLPHARVREAACLTAPTTTLDVARDRVAQHAKVMRMAPPTTLI